MRVIPGGVVEAASSAHTMILKLGGGVDFELVERKPGELTVRHLEGKPLDARHQGRTAVVLSVKKPRRSE